MLELDHIKMWCRGGKHSEENLTLRRPVNVKSQHGASSEQHAGEVVGPKESMSDWSPTKQRDG